MTVDWSKATVTVKVPVQHTATTEVQEIEVPVEQFAAMLFDAYSAGVRAEMAKRAAARIQRLQAEASGRPTPTEGSRT